jgi:hypothetical protein
MSMNPMLEASLRRMWPAFGALLVFAALTLVNQLWFRPTAARYARVLKEATDIGMPLDPNQMPRIMPPRVFALVADNTLPAVQAQEAAGSGALTSEFLGELTQRMGKRGITVISTEPSLTTQDQDSVELRAHLRVRCRYSDFVTLLDDFAQDQRLFGIDRFTITPDENAVLIELWVSRLVLKSGGSS